MFGYYFRLGVRSLRRNPALTALMVVTLAVGVAASVSTLTILHMMSSDPIPQKSSRLFVPLIDNGPVEGYTPGEDPDDIQISYKDAVNLLKGGQGVRRTALYGVSAPIQPPRADIQPFNLSGLAPTRDFFAMFDVPFLHGQAWTEQDDARGADVVVLSREIAGKLYGDADPVGQMVEFNGVRFRIVGLQVRKGSNGFQDQDDFMYAPITTVIDNIVGNVDSFTIIGARAVNKDLLPQAMGEIHRVLRQTHGLKPSDPPDYIVFNAAALLAAGKAAAKQFQLLLGVVAAISLLIGGIGVMNIMLVTVTERTREIGIRKALGAQRSDIITQFLAEAMLLASLGGVIGVLVGVGLGSLKSATMQPIVSPGSVVMSFCVSVLIGIFFGAYPASRAAALTPMEALRYE